MSRWRWSAELVGSSSGDVMMARRCCHRCLPLAWGAEVSFWAPSHFEGEGEHLDGSSVLWLGL